MTNVDEAYEKWMDEFWPRFIEQPMNMREPFKEGYTAGADALYQALFSDAKELTLLHLRALRFLCPNQEKP
jgi:hypothetical protein